MSNFSQLLKLYRTVTGRKPRGKPVSQATKKANERRLAKGQPQTPDSRIQIPKLIIEFSRLFGGERSLTTAYYSIFKPADLADGSGSVIIAVDPHSGFHFGIGNFMLRFDDPDVDVAEAQDQDEVFDWNLYSESLADCLVEFACYNLCESMPYDLHVQNTKNRRIRTEMAEYPSIALTKSGKSGAHCQPFYAPGTIIYHDLTDHTALIGFDTLQRALAFQTKHAWGYSEVFVDEE